MTDLEAIPDWDNCQEFARAQDAADHVTSFRDQFHIPKHKDGHECIYFCGNSLGLQPKGVRAAIDVELEDWARLGVDAHFHGRFPWMPYHELVREPLAEFVGAQPPEVVAMNSLTVNLHLMLVSFYRPTPTRNKILIEKHAFPSDRYAVESQIRLHGFDPKACLMELAPQVGSECLSSEQITQLIEAQGESIALILLPGVQYYTGEVLDLAAITRAAQAAGCRVGFDLAHSVGNVPLDLHSVGCDFAVWCSYKYLNAGPGAVAGCFVHQRHHAAELPRLHGWWGHDQQTRFLMEPKFAPSSGADAWQLSNPPILALAPLRVSLQIFRAAGMVRLRQKSVQLTGFLLQLIQKQLSGWVRTITPSVETQRGCQLSLMVEKKPGSARDVFRALSERGVVADWRAPNVIRVAPVPLYNQFIEVYRFVEILNEVVRDRCT
ncbi:MAG: kynureninase [Gammaproteobacteria bacterium]